MSEKKGLWIKAMTKNKGLHARFIEDIFYDDLLWFSVEQVTEEGIGVLWVHKTPLWVDIKVKKKSEAK